MATSHTIPHPSGASDQDASEDEFLSPELVEETLCGKMRKLREDELFEAMDCMGGADETPPIEKKTEPEAQPTLQAYGQVRRTHGY